MEELLCFLNRLDFIEKVNRDLIEEMRCIRRVLVIELGD